MSIIIKMLKTSPVNVFVDSQFVKLDVIAQSNTIHTQKSMKMSISTIRTQEAKLWQSFTAHNKKKRKYLLKNEIIRAYCDGVFFFLFV